MGFVSGVQLSANDMLKVGDWIEMCIRDSRIRGANQPMFAAKEDSGNAVEVKYVPAQVAEDAVAVSYTHLRSGYIRLQINEIK